jgi:salicylate hydroxylase
MRIVVVGAGVAGGVIARGLRDLAGVELTLIEQVAPGDHASAGNGLNIGPNALLALDRVLPALAAELRAASLPWMRWHAALIDGTPLYEIPLLEVAAGPGVRTRWSELYRIAREPVADLTRYHERCAGVAIGVDGKPRIALERLDRDERAEIAGIDLVIAADGRYSGLRERLCGAPAVRHLGVANFRGLAEDRSNGLVDDLVQYFCGPNRMLAYKLPDGLVYVTGNFPIVPGAEIADAEKTAGFLRGAFLPRTGAVDPAGAFLVEAPCDNVETLHWSRLQDNDTRFRDPSGRVLFVGDSAHAMAPTLGQGATQAIEDGCAFVDLFRARYRHAGRAGIDVAELTAGFEALRRERIAFVKKLSWDSSTSMLAGADPAAIDRAKATPAYRLALRRLYVELGFGAPADHAA